MKHIFKVENVKCSGCANTLKSRLRDKFGEIDVNLELYPREITVDIEPHSIAELQIALKKLGYPLSSDRLGFVDTTTTKAQSFLSCAIGKIES